MKLSEQLGLSSLSRCAGGGRQELIRAVGSHGGTGNTEEDGGLDFDILYGKP
jgi:hypothetical protein